MSKDINPNLGEVQKNTPINTNKIILALNIIQPIVILIFVFLFIYSPVGAMSFDYGNEHYNEDGRYFIMSVICIMVGLLIMCTSVIRLLSTSVKNNAFIIGNLIAEIMVLSAEKTVLSYILIFLLTLSLAYACRSEMDKEYKEYQDEIDIFSE